MFFRGRKRKAIEKEEKEREEKEAGVVSGKRRN